MFQFPGSAFSYPMNSDMDTTPLRVVGFPIRKSPDQSLLTAPRSISVDALALEAEEGRDKRRNALGSCK